MKSHDINWLRFLPYHPPGWFRPNVRVAEPGLKTWKPCAKSHARRSHQSGFKSKSTPYQRLLYIYIYIHSTKVDFRSKFIKVVDFRFSRYMMIYDDIWIYIYGMYMIYPHLLPRRRVDNNALCIALCFGWWVHWKTLSRAHSSCVVTRQELLPLSVECGVDNFARTPAVSSGFWPDMGIQKLHPNIIKMTSPYCNSILSPHYKSEVWVQLDMITSPYYIHIG